MLRDLAHGKANINKTPMRRQMIMVLIATVPMIAAVFLNDYIESLFTSTLLVGFMLLITAVLLTVTDMHGFGRKDASTATWRDALIIGAMQLVAIGTWYFPVRDRPDRGALRDFHVHLQ